MKGTASQECADCGTRIAAKRSDYRDTESGLSNVILRGVEIAECRKCGSEEVRIPRPAKIHRAIAQALVNSPARLTGEQLRFLRKHLGLTGEKLAAYLHTDKTKISKWERGEDPIGPATDRLVRLLAAALDTRLRAAVSAVAEHLPLITDESGNRWQLVVDVATLRTSFSPISRAA